MSHVEFLGVPGSGKSSIYKTVLTRMADVVGLDEAVRRSLRATATDPMTRLAARVSRTADSRIWKAAYGRSPDRFQGMVDFVSAYPGVIEAVARAVPGMSGVGARPGLGWVMNLMARYQLASRIGGEDLLVDEGFYQRAVVLFAYPFSESAAPTLESYLEAVPPPRLVVCVDAPVEICRRRLTSRGWSDRVAEDARDSFLDDAFRVVDLAREHASRQLRTLVLDGTKPIHHNATQVIEHLTLGSEDPS